MLKHASLDQCSQGDVQAGTQRGHDQTETKGTSSSTEKSHKQSTGDVKALIAHSTTLSHLGNEMRRQETKADVALTAQGADALSSQSHMVLLTSLKATGLSRESSAAILTHPLIFIPYIFSIQQQPYSGYDLQNTGSHNCGISLAKQAGKTLPVLMQRNK